MEATQDAAPASPALAASQTAGVAVGPDGEGKTTSPEAPGAGTGLPLAKPTANDAVVPAAQAAPPASVTTSPPPVGEASAKAVTSTPDWAACPQRAWGFDVLQCPCGGRRKLIAVIRNPTQVEKIHRHVGQWRESGERDGDDVIAIRGPPRTFDDDVEETPGDKFDGVDDPVEADWAA